ncbi:ankyrin repeat protein [Evansella vedderi]|uniref:Ankyrin repeat protein n=1 Tax=Evansella vedderi TaxID=38282 RepID=A0ABT9ZWJ8_9BACI|nr:ankyrin repeat domain-containing protein [Evansella vedderi]MDQ0255600.1 ankyrin repeat protein [Evansella vedderi]
MVVENVAYFRDYENNYGNKKWYIEELRPKIKHLLENSGLFFDFMFKNNNTSLIYASYHGDIELIRKLVQKDANIHHRNDEGDTPIIAAVLSGNVNTVRELIQHGANPNDMTQGLTLLILACSDKNYEMVQMLLESGANPNLYTMGGNYTPLQAAALNGDKKIVEKLIAYGADVNYVSPLGLSAEIVAIEKGNYEISNLLNKVG